MSLIEELKRKNILNSSMIITFFTYVGESNSPFISAALFWFSPHSLIILFHQLHAAFPMKPSRRRARTSARSIQGMEDHHERTQVRIMNNKPLCYAAVVHQMRGHHTNKRKTRFHGPTSR